MLPTLYIKKKKEYVNKWKEITIWKNKEEGTHYGIYKQMGMLAGWAGLKNV